MSASIERLAEQVRAISGIRSVEVRGSLAPHTTWRVGGPADLLCVAERVEGLIAAAHAVQESGVPWRVLGRGSNVLVRDGGIAGVVILNRSSALHIDALRVVADGGLLLSTLARRTAAAGLAGLEWSAGIPGSVGGAIVSNAGAHGGEMKDTLQCVYLLDTGGAAYWEEGHTLDLSYRHSRLRVGAGSAAVVLQAAFVLRLEPADLIKARMEAQKRQRVATQPLSQPTAGSVFKNPIGDSAARLIDQAGLKGLSVGGAQVSSRHANFIVAGSAATAGDVLALIDLVRECVQLRFGVELTLEVQVIGQ